MSTFEFILNAVVLVICIYHFIMNLSCLGKESRKQIDEYNGDCYQNIKNLSEGNETLLSFSVYVGNILIMIKTVIPIVLTAYVAGCFGMWVAACAILLITAISLSVTADDLMNYVQSGAEKTKKPMIFNTIEHIFGTVYFLAGLVILCSRMIGMIV